MLVLIVILLANIGAVLYLRRKSSIVPRNQTVRPRKSSVESIQVTTNHHRSLRLIQSPKKLKNQPKEERFPNRYSMISTENMIFYQSNLPFFIESKKVIYKYNKTTAISYTTGDHEKREREFPC